MLITGEFVKREIKEHPDMYRGCYFIVEHRFFGFPLIGIFLGIEDDKVSFKDLYEIKDGEYNLLEDRVIYYLDDLKIYAPTSTQIYSFLAFKNKIAEKMNRKDIIEPFEHMSHMLRSSNILYNSVFGDFGTKFNNK